MSLNVKNLCLSGESESPAFKRLTPDQLHDLAEEIVTFFFSGIGQCIALLI